MLWNSKLTKFFLSLFPPKSWDDMIWFLLFPYPKDKGSDSLYKSYFFFIWENYLAFLMIPEVRIGVWFIASDFMLNRMFFPGLSIIFDSAYSLPVWLWMWSKTSLFGSSGWLWNLLCKILYLKFYLICRILLISPSC